MGILRGAERHVQIPNPAFGDSSEFMGCPTTRLETGLDVLVEVREPSGLNSFFRKMLRRKVPSLEDLAAEKHWRNEIAGFRIRGGKR